MSHERHERVLIERFERLGVPWRIHRHPPVFTVEEARRLRGDVPGAHVKNLFLRDKKEQMWLVTAREDRAIDLRALRALLGSSGNPSFGSPDRLRRVLGVEPGSVTPLAVVNDVAGAVRVVIDASLRDADLLSVHPNHNAASVVLAPSDLVRVLEDAAHAPRWIALP